MIDEMSLYQKGMFPNTQEVYMSLVFKIALVAVVLVIGFVIHMLCFTGSIKTPSPPKS